MDHWLKEFRRHFALSQAELAEKLGVARATVNRWEGGLTDTPLDLRTRLNALALVKPRPRVIIGRPRDRATHGLRGKWS
jgi:DNA-binding XRE family transcriptional regulator